MITRERLAHSARTISKARMTSAGHATPRSRLHRIYLVVLVFLKDKYVLYVYLYLFKDTNGGRPVGGSLARALD